MRDSSCDACVIGVVGLECMRSSSEGNFVWETWKCSQEIRFKTRVSARTICLMHMSDGVLFTGLMEMHSIGDLEMLTGNSIHNTSVSSHHMSDAETWKCSQELAPYV